MPRKAERREYRIEFSRTNPLYPGLSNDNMIDENYEADEALWAPSYPPLRVARRLAAREDVSGARLRTRRVSAWVDVPIEGTEPEPQVAARLERTYRDTNDMLLGAIEAKRRLIDERNGLASKLAASEAVREKAERECDELRLKLTETCQESAADALEVEKLRLERDELAAAWGALLLAIESDGGTLTVGGMPVAENVRTLARMHDAALIERAEKAEHERDELAAAIEAYRKEIDNEADVLDGPQPGDAQRPNWANQAGLLLDRIMGRRAIDPAEILREHEREKDQKIAELAAQVDLFSRAIYAAHVPHPKTTAQEALRAYLAKQAKPLVEALETVMIGGNSLASSLINWLGPGVDTFPPCSARYDQAQSVITDPLIYDVWVCWKSITEAHAALDAWRREHDVPVPTGAKGGEV